MTKEHLKGNYKVDAKIEETAEEADAGRELPVLQPVPAR